MQYRITYGYNGAARSFNVHAESEGEALEQFDTMAENADADIEFVGIAQIEE